MQQIFKKYPKMMPKSADLQSGVLDHVGGETSGRFTSPTPPLWGVGTGPAQTSRGVALNGKTPSGGRVKQEKKGPRLRMSFLAVIWTILINGPEPLRRGWLNSPSRRGWLNGAARHQPPPKPSRSKPPQKVWIFSQNHWTVSVREV